MSDRMWASLASLHLGDCFGQQFFAAPIQVGNPPPGPWYYTDDSAQGNVLARHLARRASIDTDGLAAEFAAEYIRSPNRGYGASAQSALKAIHEGADWRTIARSAFRGLGSMGNGAAMRVAPLGAFFAADTSVLIREAGRSAEVTHANVNAIAGAIAVALCAGAVASGLDSRSAWQAVMDGTPTSLLRDVLDRARQIPAGAAPADVAAAVGSGERVLAHDTVPYCIRMALEGHETLEDALWATVSGLGDRDTTCAIVGGILGARPGISLPGWADRAEPLPT